MGLTTEKKSGEEWTWGRAAAAAAMARVCEEMFTEIPDTASTLLTVVEWLKEQSDCRCVQIKINGMAFT